jgi:hypothetical protein
MVFKSVRVSPCAARCCLRCSRSRLARQARSARVYPASEVLAREDRPMSPPGLFVLCSLPVTRRGLRTYLVYPAAVCPQSHILARGDDCSAPLTYLAGDMRLIVFRIEVLQLPIFAIVFLYLPLGRVFIAVSGNHSYRALLRVRDRGAILATPV